MKRRVSLAFSLCLAAGLVLPGASGMLVAAAETEAVSETDGETDPSAASLTEPGEFSEDADVEDCDAEEEMEKKSYYIGELIFAQCDNFINIRSEASTEGEVIAKIYNNCAAIIIGAEDDWFKIASGNAVGYAKAEFFATGEEAEAIAEETAYNVATVQVDYLNIRSEASIESDVIDVLKEEDEIEVILYGDEWMEVAISDDSYGYIKSEYVDYDTYYPTAETREEEEARLIREAEEAAAAETEEIADSDDTVEITEAVSSAEIYTEQAAVQAETYTEPEVYPQTYVYEDPEQYESPAETEYVQAETEAPAETEAQQTEAPVVYTEVVWNEVPEQTEAAETEVPVLTAIEQTEVPVQTYNNETPVEVAEVSYETYEEPAADLTEETAQTEEISQTEEPAQAEEPAAVQTEETVQTEVPDETEAASEADDSSAALGQSIADYALQFIGNPYVYGGTSLTNGADCSGFVQSVFSHFGIQLLRTADAQALCGTAVSSSEAQAGDLFFYSSVGGYIDHVAIYIGDGRIVHASNSARGIVTDNAFYDTPVCIVRCY